MKKLRSLNQLTDELDKDLGRRKQCLTKVKFVVAGAKHANRRVVAESALCILYGHWEGFVKFSGKCYLNYVSGLGLPMEQLNHGIVASCLRTKMRALKDAKKIGKYREIIMTLRGSADEVGEVPWQGPIEVYGNLDSAALTEILVLVGCEPSGYAPHKALIDEKLLRHRNRIAHNGSDPEFDPSDYESVHNQIIGLIQRFKDDVENAAATHCFQLPTKRALEI